MKCNKNISLLELKINVQCFHSAVALILSGYRRRIPNVHEPIILNTTSTNYTAIAGETAVLYCAVDKLGTKTVRQHYKAPPPSFLINYPWCHIFNNNKYIPLNYYCLFK